jgi:hypothetical protein
MIQSISKSHHPSDLTTIDSAPESSHPPKVRRKEPMRHPSVEIKIVPVVPRFINKVKITQADPR